MENGNGGKNYSDYRLFRNDWQTESDKVNWCPLYGELPESLSGHPSKTQASKCFEIIQSARRLLKTFRNQSKRDLYNNREANLDFWQVFRFTKCPYPKEVPFYPKNKLKAIRQVFDKWDSQILPYTERIRKKPYETFNGIPCYLSEEIYEWPEDALKDCIYHTTGINNLKHYEILAVLAIRRAWDSLEEIFIFDVPEDEFLIRSVQQAILSLSTATEIRQQQIINKNQDIIKSIKPNADRFLRHQKKRRETIKTHNVKKEIKGWNLLLPHLPAIIKARSRKNDSEIARALVTIDYEKDFSMPELNEYKHTWKIDTLRKKISKESKTSLTKETT